MEPEQEQQTANDITKAAMVQILMEELTECILNPSEDPSINDDMFAILDALDLIDPLPEEPPYDITSGIERFLKWLRERSDENCAAE